MSPRVAPPQGTDPAVGGDLYPCSATQNRCWFLDRMAPGTPALNVAIRWKVEGRFSAAGFEAAFRDVIARHEILRTRFVDDGGRPAQQVMERAEFRLSEIDIRTTPPEAQEDRIEAIATESASLPFDLTQPAPIRATLIRLGNDSAILAITVHQICFDGWSIRVLGREIGQFAAAHDAGEQVALPDLPLQYAGYALWQQAYFDSPAFAEDLEPWRARLEGAPYFELPPDRPRPLTRSAACAMVKTDLPPAFGDRLNAEAKARSMSPFAYGAGVLSAMLARCADTPEVTIGTQVAGRTETDLEALIGVFINNVVLRFPTAPDTALGDHLNAASRVVQDALIGQHVPFNKLVEMLNPERDASRTPLISINFILQHAFMETARYGPFELSSAPSHAPGAIYDLSFVLIGRASGWRMTLEYNSDLFEEKTAQNLLVLWQAAFDQAFERPEAPLSQMPQPKVGADERADEAHQLARIEAALTRHGQVAAAAALPYSGQGGTRCVHAFVAPDPLAPIQPLETLPQRLADHLTVDLRGTATVDGISVLREMPRDAAGNVAKARLPLAAGVAARLGQAVTTAPGGSTDIDDIATRLAPIWAELLGLDTVPPSANFFDLGGHSLLTVRMLARIETEFGQRLSLATAYHSPTLRALAAHLAGPVAGPAPQMPRAADWRVLPLQDGGTGIPLIAINNAQTVYALSQAFDTPRPAVAVRTYDKSRGIALTPRSFEEIAGDYVDAVRAAQPEGPYALFGVCVHGNLAMEVASQLRAQGEEVAAVFLKDVWEPRYAIRVGQSRLASLLGRMHFLRTRLRFLRRGDISLAAFLGAFGAIRRSGVLRLAVGTGLMDRVRNTDLDAEQEEFITYLSEARNRHQPGIYDGPVVHFVTSESPRGGPFEDAMGWDRIVTGGLRTERLRELSIAQGRNAGIPEAAAIIEAVLSSHGTPDDGGQPNA